MFPISVWVPHGYAREGPLIFVTPTNGMVIRPGQYISGEGRVYHPYLASWREDVSKLSFYFELSSAMVHISKMLRINTSCSHRSRRLLSTETRKINFSITAIQYRGLPLYTPRRLRKRTSCLLTSGAAERGSPTLSQGQCASTTTTITA